MPESRFGEYASKGNYHAVLDHDWPYAPVYLAKMVYVRKYLNKVDPATRIIDLGSGEGILVREYRERGMNITGLDLNYESPYVRRGDMLDTGYPDGSYDMALCLDVLEHLTFESQGKAIAEIARIIRPGGTFLMSVPNMGHLASRLSFLVTGNLIRTSTIERHPGDRPIGEFIKMLMPYFHIRTRRGIFPTFPIISLLTRYVPAKTLLLHKIYNRFFAYPNWCFLNIFVLERKSLPTASGSTVSVQAAEDTPPTRILLMNSEYPPVGGGAGNACANIARELVVMGQDVCVLTTAYENLPDDETVDGVRVVRVRALRHRADRSGAFEQGVFILFAFSGLMRLLRRWKPDVILAFFGVPAGVVAMIAKMFYKIPYVVSLRGGDVPGFRPYDFGTYHKIIAPLLRRVWKNAASIVANSTGLRTLAMKFERHYPIMIIPNGVDVDRFVAPVERRWDLPRLLFVGRVVHQKGLDLLFPALGKLTDLPWELTIVGDGPEHAALQELAAKLSIAERVHFVGWQRGADLECHYNESNLLVLPSRHEGMPNVVLEAMASGLPVLATRIAGSEELVLPGRTGELVDPESESALEEKLRPLLADPGLRKRLGAAGRQRVVDGFTWTGVARQYLHLLQSLRKK